MIVIKVELWPFGEESKKRDIARAVIGNDGTGSYDMGNYDARFYTIASTNGVESILWQSRVVKFSRKETVWSLIKQALKGYIESKEIA